MAKAASAPTSRLPRKLHNNIASPMERPRASARLRKVFRYPDDEAEPESLDEEEQEQLIKDLKKQNEESNDIWLKCLIIVSGLCFIIFLPLFIQATSRQVRLMCILAITSTVMTAYILLFIPTSVPNSAMIQSQVLSPAQRFVPYMNGVLALLIGLNGLNWRDRAGAPDGFWAASWVPLGIFSTIMVARRILVEVDPSELWDLKYELKGA